MPKRIGRFRLARNPFYESRIDEICFVYSQYPEKTDMAEQKSHLVSNRGILFARVRSRKEKLGFAKMVSSSVVTECV